MYVSAGECEASAKQSRLQLMKAYAPISLMVFTGAAKLLFSGMALWKSYLDYPLSSKQILVFLSLFHICMYLIWITAMIATEIINNVIHCKYRIQYRSFSVHGRGERDKEIGGGGGERSTQQIRADSKSILRAISTNVLLFPTVGE